MQPYELTLTAAAEEIAAGRLSPVELTDSALGRIEATEPAINAFVHVCADLAREQARTAEAEIAAGRYRGPLHGIPLGVKDIYDTAGIPSTSSSKVREGYVPDTDAVAVERLRSAGMVMVGKTHTHEFAYGGRTHTTRNPWDTSRIPGGSSGGSGAAVAVGSCLVGMGTDTAGSIRIPATLCGTVGLKPTHGRTSRRGVTSLSWSLDHVGPLTRNVRDAALVLDVIAGHDPLDPASVDVPVPGYAAGTTGDVRGLRIGVPTNFFFDHVHPDVEASVRAAVDVLVGVGAQTREVTIPYPDQVLAAEWGIVLPEAAAYHQEALRTKGELYRPETRMQLEVGELVLATDYIKALRVRTLIQRAWAQLFADVDVVVAPVQPFAAPVVDQMDVTWPDGTTESVDLAMVRLTSPANLTGLPSIALPTGFDAAGLPLGMQLMGRPFDEATLLDAGTAYEAAAEAVGRLAEVV
ncbi:amidase [Geodermatophilus sabuli]|uniref:Aspartyl-tRNA(Asn)/glutamyl-tRNA(Gln) amidotransferase subunit A n=1 Tax=Geodermatophilus sabuli TaxID=1564158 RepID=A0A285E8Q9_9ACTN|nr:amidase [Geodermatophilus sabuli]MBB3085195.1 aspartyl-tRNA(Asn)/glutamyl-tRNA(Gln) amidotransferase subunit A [Geodermatophilus sabuli]SNX95397.1 aspartyl-tRNA(Asn)/glutamyl-tRNA(Gln) amidotransferase subunit A [Geodermatophilus sabuli]